jgi:CelD/BcsL family acetyltransferase involved in cellulose biosynthesis
VIRTRVISDPVEAESLAPSWDALALRLKAPYCSPHWMLAWWKHVAPPGAALRLLVVEEGKHLIGLAPLYAGRRRGMNEYRFLSAGISGRLGVLGEEDRRPEVHTALTETFGRLDPTPDALYLDAVPPADRWEPLNIFGRGPSWTYTTYTVPVPVMTFRDAGYEEWLKGKSTNFRQSVRRHRRRLEAEGARFRRSTPDEVGDDLAAFARLHLARWASRGGSDVVHPGVVDMLHEAATRLLPERRMRVWVIDVDGTPISVHIFVAAKGDAYYWLGGFDERWGRHQPTLQALLAAVEECFELGDRRLDLGGGRYDYKSRLATQEDMLAWRLVVPKGRRYLRDRALLLPSVTRRELARRLPQNVKDRVKRLMSR